MHSGPSLAMAGPMAARMVRMGGWPVCIASQGPDYYVAVAASALADKGLCWLLVTSDACSTGRNLPSTVRRDMDRYTLRDA